MRIQLDNVGKRYRYEWIFRGLDMDFQSGGRYAILGPNGSGKSTLMKVLSGHLSPSAGKVSHSLGGEVVSPDRVYRHISYAAPYIGLIEELTLKEMLAFHTRFKPLRDGIELEGLVEILALPRSATHKEIAFFSSGMKQRVKLALALASQSDLVLLDEPGTNLDRQGMDWYADLARQFGGSRSIIVASNEERDYDFCPTHVHITKYKRRSQNLSS